MFGESILALILIGIALGITHAFEIDHIAAVATISTSANKPKHAAFIGAWWGLGHTITLFILGIIVMLLNQVISSDISNILEGFVGVVLVFLGIRMILEVKKHKLHVHSHQHDGQTHVHVHSHEKTISHDHRHTSLVTGLIHGVAGTGALLLLTLALTTSLAEGMTFMISFGVGSIFGMTALAVGIGYVMSALKQYSYLANAGRVGAAAFSICLGLFIIASTSGLLS